MSRLPGDVEAALTDFTTDELLQEVSRRARALRDELEGAPLCDGCIHYVLWADRLDPPGSGRRRRTVSEVPEDYNPCMRGHVMEFRTPEPWEDPHDYGYFRPGCVDRKDRAAPPPPEPPRRRALPPASPMRLQSGPPRGGRPTLAK